MRNSGRLYDNIIDTVGGTDQYSRLVAATQQWPPVDAYCIDQAAYNALVQCGTPLNRIAYSANVTPGPVA